MSSRREPKRARLRKVPVGDKKTPVLVCRASITAPTVGVDFGRDINIVINPWFCKITTVEGVTRFDSSNIEQVVTHEFAGRYDERIDESMVISHSGKYFRVISIENYDDRGQFSVLLCTERGDFNKPVNEA